MSEPGDGGLLHERINIRGEIESIRATLAGLEKLVNEKFTASKEAVTAALMAADTATKAAFAAAEKATDKAFESATSLSRAHNDLLRKMEKQGETFATKDDLKRIEGTQSKMQGAIGLAAFIIPLLTGLATFIATR